MTIDNENLFNSIMASLDRIEHIHAEDIPNIDLYMDQVTTFMDKRLRKTTRDPNGDKILTKTMINNYAKNDLLPPPVKKKYSKEHILVLIFIYYFKGIMSINDIETLLKPVTDQYFGSDEEFGLEEIYSEVFSLERSQIDVLKADVAEKFAHSQEVFQDAPKKEQAFLQSFAFVCMLSYDVYVKKLLIEKIIDGIRLDPKQQQAKKAAAPKSAAAKGTPPSKSAATAKGAQTVKPAMEKKAVKPTES